MGRLSLQDAYYIRPLYQDWKTQQIYLIHRNKHREAAKLGRQRNSYQIKEEKKSSEKRTKLNGDKLTTR